MPADASETPMRYGSRIALLTLGLLAAFPPAQVWAARDRAASARISEAGKIGFEPLLNVIVTWLSASFDLPATYDHPNVELVPAARLSAMRYGAVSLENRRDVVAVYHDEKRSIFLSETWTGRTPAEVSVLVHEMVHHLQNLAKHTYHCPEAREKLAYQAQEQWLNLFGQSLESEFGVDKLTLKVTTACM